MQRLSVPWVFTGPSGSGKMSLARRWIEEAHGVKLIYPMEVRTFSVGDGYEARVHASPYHFEIDIPNLSMQDKQIIGELLTMFLSSGDVLNSLRSSVRKLVILRRAHCLSLPAAIRVRAVIQQFVLPANASGMIWMTAREITGPLALLDDAFIRYRVPRMSLNSWEGNENVPVPYRTKDAWNRLDGRPERAVLMAKYFPDGTGHWPRRIQDYYDEMVLSMIEGSKRIKEPNIRIVEWMRARVYEALSFCHTGPEIVDSCAAAVTRNHDRMHPATFWNVMTALSESEPHTSYRTPLSLEWAVFNMFEEMLKSPSVVRDGNGNDGPVTAVQAFGDSSAADTSASVAPKAKTSPKKRAAVRTK
jgi:hypothetical protein